MYWNFHYAFLAENIEKSTDHDSPLGRHFWGLAKFKTELYTSRITCQELPNQMVLQTRHRNAAAKNCTLNSKCNKICRWTCCSDSVNFTEPCTNLACCSTQVDLTLNWPTSTAPNKLILPWKSKVQTKVFCRYVNTTYHEAPGETFTT